ncbi:MAG: fasciclin domain-containing protein [Gemmatimonadota bacterium]
MRSRILAGASALALMATVNTASAQVSTTTQQTTTTTATVATQDIIGTLKAAGNFTTFLKVVDMAGLTAQLQGAGPFTVFAPTDEAFARIPAATRDSLMADNAALETVVKNHIVSGKITSDEVRHGNAGVGFMGGNPLSVDTTGASVRVNGAEVVKGNIVATNGLIHAIDTVYLPVTSVRVNGTTPADSMKREEPKPKP